MPKLTEEDIQAMLDDGEITEKGAAKLRAKIAVTGNNNVVADNHSVGVGGDVHGDIYMGNPTDDPAEALHIYRRVLVQSGGGLPLRGIDVDASNPSAGRKNISLAQVYIDLDTTRQVPVSGKRNKTRPVHRAESGARQSEDGALRRARFRKIDFRQPSGVGVGISHAGPRCRLAASSA